MKKSNDFTILLPHQKKSFLTTAYCVVVTTRWACSLYSLIFLLSFVTTLKAQPSINSSTFFQQKLQESAAFANVTTNAPSFKAALIDELEIRTETRDFDFTRETYLLRLRANNKKIRLAQKQLYEQIQEDATLEQAFYQREFIQLAYEDWISIYLVDLKRTIYKEQLLVYQDIETVLLKLGQVEELKIKELLAVQRDITAMYIAIKTLDNTIADYLADRQPDFSDLIPITSIQKIVFLEANKLQNALILTKKQALKEAAIATEISMELAENNRWLDFLQVRYQGPHSNSWNERLSVGVGFTIPVSSEKNLKMQELKIEQTLLKKEFEVTQTLYQEKIARNKQNLRAAITTYELTKNLVDAQHAKGEALLAKASQKEGSTPLLFLYNEVEQRKQALDLVKLEEAVYENYLDYLVLTEQLFIQPFHNFLLAD